MLLLWYEDSDTPKEKLDRGAANRKNLYRRITQAITDLEYTGLVQTSGQRGKRNITLTEKGRTTINTIYTVSTVS